MKRDDPREWEHWLILLGACLSGSVARELVLSKLDPSDCPYNTLRPMLVALKTGDVVKIRAEFDKCYYLHGLKGREGGTLQGIVDRVAETAGKRRRVAEAEESLRRART